MSVNGDCDGDIQLNNEILEANEPAGPEFAEEEDVALLKYLQTPCFEGHDGTRCSFLYTTQLTCSNVVSTVVTARSLRDNSSSFQRAKSLDGARTSGGTRPNQESDIGASSPASIYGSQGSYPHKKGAAKRRNGGKYQAQLPAFRRSLPPLPIPLHQLNQELHQVSV